VPVPRRRAHRAQRQALILPGARCLTRPLPASLNERQLKIHGAVVRNTMCEGQHKRVIGQARAQEDTIKGHKVKEGAAPLEQSRAMREVVRGILLNTVPSDTGQFLNAESREVWLKNSLLLPNGQIPPADQASSTTEWDPEGLA